MTSSDTHHTATNLPGTIELECPLQRGEQSITRITLRKPSAGELRGIKLADLLQADVASLMTLLPRISEPTLTSADVARLDLVDLVAVTNAVSDFFLSKAQRACLPV